MNGIMNESAIVNEYFFYEPLIHTIDSILINVLEIVITILSIHLNKHVYVILNLQIIETMKKII